MSLYEHIPHPHVPRNPHKIHLQEREEKANQSRAAWINEKLAVWLTNHVGTMWTAYLFTCLSLLGFPALTAVFGPTVGIYVVWTSQNFIQLVLLPTIMVGQNVLDRSQQLLAQETHHSVEHILHDVEQSKLHLSAQDEKIISIDQQNAEQITFLRQMLDILLKELASLRSDMTSGDEATRVLLADLLAKYQTLSTERSAA